MTNVANPYDHHPEGEKMEIPEGSRVESAVLGDFVQTMMPQGAGQETKSKGHSPGCELIAPWNDRQSLRHDRQSLRSNKPSPRRLNLDHEKTKNGLAQLVLTVVKLLHELLEKQALRRIDGGGLTDAEIERLGFTLMRQSEEITRISREFGLKDDDLNLDLGPLGKLL
ncbi:MAG: gas vesicle protein K [Syntrophales bacterium]